MSWAHARCKSGDRFIVLTVVVNYVCPPYWHKGRCISCQGVGSLRLGSGKYAVTVGGDIIDKPRRIPMGVVCNSRNISTYTSEICSLSGYVVIIEIQ